MADDTRKASWEAITADVKALIALLDTAIAIQTQSRIYLIELPEVQADEAQAVAYAKQNRLDLQNLLGQVTDAWRQVTVAANKLRGDVNVVANANVVTQPGRLSPVAFTADASSYSVGLQIDGPLNRVAERNAYRASLITYQRAKRAYVAGSDQVELQIRRDLRQLNQLRLSFEISRQQVLSAARQVENSKLQLVRPGGGGGPVGGGGGGGDTVTLNLLQAYATQLSNLNALVSNFISYEQQRVQLLLDLEALQLDQRGFPANAPGTPHPATDGPPPEAGERLAAPQPVPPPARTPAGS